MSLNEILQVADVVAREKGIDNEQVVSAMEEAVQKIAKAKYGHDHDIQALIDRKTGDISLFRQREVVEVVENPTLEIDVVSAKAIDASLSVGDCLKEPLAPVDMGRGAAQIARQIISQRVREAERERQYEEFKEKVGEIVSGVVKRAEFGNYVIDVGRNECLLKREETIPRELLKPGDRVRAYVLKLDPESKMSQVILSRSHPQFMAKLFQQEVPEIYEGIIEVVSVARDPGSRAKIAVRSKDSSIDPVGSCVGIRGSRVQAVINELQGEKIDIVPWSKEVPTFVINALAPASIMKVIYDEERRKVSVVVPDDQQSIAIGRRGQNVRLASLLTGLEVSISSESEDYQKTSSNFKRASHLFIEALDVDDVIAHLLIAEGYETIEEVAEAEISELMDIEGFEEDLVKELRSRAQDYVGRQLQIQEEKLAAFTIDPLLSNLVGMSGEHLLDLAQNNILRLDDLADLSRDELLDILPELSPMQADEWIMGARSQCFGNG